MDVALFKETDNILSLKDSSKDHAIPETFFRDQFFQIRLELWFIVIPPDDRHDASRHVIGGVDEGFNGQILPFQP